MPKSPSSSPYVRAAIKAVKSPAGKAITNYAKAQTFKYLSDKLRVTPSGVSVTVGKTISGRNINTPTVFGNFGAVTSTTYVEGSLLNIPEYIKKEGRNINIINSAANIDAAVSAQGVYQINTNSPALLNNTANNYGRLFTQTRTAVNSSRFYLHQATMETKITNSSNVGVTLQIMEIVPRNTVDQTVGTNPAAAPQNAWAQGLLEASPAGMSGSTQSAYTTDTYGAQPFDSEVFSQYFSVKKVFNVELPASTTHVHDSVYNICKVFEPDAIVNATLPGSIKHFTKWLLIIVRGNPVHDSTNSDSVGSAPIACDLTFSQRLITYGMPGATTIAGLTSSMPAVATPQVYTTPTTEQLVATD